MARYLIFNSLEAFNVVNAMLNTAFGYPNLTAKTLTYAQPVEHPSNGLLAMAITEEAFELLTTEQQAATVASLSPDWSPPPPIDLE